MMPRMTTQLLRQRFIVGIISCLAVATTACQQDAREASSDRTVRHFQNWPEGKSPKEIGDRVAARFVESPHQNFGRPTPPRVITYPEVCTWYGALTFADEADDAELRKQLVERFEPLFGERKKMI